MREFKYRAYLTNRNIMVEVVGIDLINETINFKDDEGYYSMENLCFAKLMQYTGLKDKNGIKVYEGDILKLRDNHGNKVVKYNNEWGAFIDETSTGVLGLYYDDKEDFEIIGNIYENHELIREVK